jgi:hypothetical protein
MVAMTGLPRMKVLANVSDIFSIVRPFVATA